MADRDTLTARYRAALYQVEWRGARFVLRVDAYSAELAACHAAHGVRCSVFVSAWNPRSEQQSAAANDAAHAQLLARLQHEGYRWLTASGQDPAGQWPAEQSLLVLGMPPDAAIRCGRDFNQNAILLAGADAVPRLEWISSS